MDIQDKAIWKAAVAGSPAGMLLPIPSKRFTMASNTRLASAGSCFAQHLRVRLANRIDYLQVEPVENGQPGYSAAYGNIYTIQQLLQLFDEAFGDPPAFEPAWRRKDNRYVDPFRPFISPTGFDCEDDVWTARLKHLGAVRRMFEQCEVFIFTLGLTEAWRAVDSQAIVGINPRRLNQSSTRFKFCNFNVNETIGAVDAFVQKITSMSPRVKIIFTVSPVPLAVTFSEEHVLLATSHSKAILRVTCSEAVARHPNVYYFPAFEIIFTPFAKQQYFRNDLRAVNEEGVAHVMRLFDATYMPSSHRGHNAKSEALIVEPDEVICDDEGFAPSVGFP